MKPTFENVLTAVAVIVVAMTAATVAFGQEVRCVPTELAEENHEERGDTLVISGLLHTGNLFRVFEGTDGVFGIVVSTPDGNTCLIATGEYLQVEQPQPRKRPNL